MEVLLYVYDLSKGLARQMSLQFLGTQIDAVYHTAIVLEGIEYFFGAGIQSTRAGTTHHGKPMEVISLGRTELPIELTLEYLESLKSIYSPESYDLFMHNCNNFSHDFAMFLVGKGIPDHITQLPQTVLNTPFGQMLRPSLEQSMRSITQAPVVALPPSTELQSRTTGSVRNIVSLDELQPLLVAARASCAVLFFTSSTCAPCKLLYPAYDELAREAGQQAVLIKVDINHAHSIASNFNVRATPTIMTFLKGEKQEEWSGADVERLRSSIEYLIRAANPPHPHANLSTRALLAAASKPIQYTKVPPLDKLVVKLGSLAYDPSVFSMQTFLKRLQSQSKQDNPVPDLPSFAAFLIKCTKELDIASLFAAYDLLRVALIDPRVCAFFAEKQWNHTFIDMLNVVNSMGPEVPYNLRIVSLHLTCNYLSGPLAIHLADQSSDLVAAIIHLATSSLLDTDHSNVRVAAASLAFDLASAHHHARSRPQSTSLTSEQQVELVAALAESLGNESDSAEAATGLLLSLALLMHMAPADSESLDLCKALDVSALVEGKASFVLKNAASEEAIALLTKGLAS